MFTIATKIDGKETLPEAYRTWLVKYDGMVYGELKKDHTRWKSAGGSAWKGSVIRDGIDVSFYDKDRNKVLQWLKTDGFNQSDLCKELKIC